MMNGKNWNEMTEEEKQTAKQNWRMMHGRMGRSLGWHSPIGLGIFLVLAALALLLLVHAFGGAATHGPMMWR